jgi:uncharacterized protein with HEPN domain
VKHPERVEDYLEHIAEAITRATDYLRHTDAFAAFEEDQRSQDAVVRNIEIIGEAVAKIGNVAPDFIGQHPEIPRNSMDTNARHAQRHDPRVLLRGFADRLEHRQKRSASTEAGD